MDNAEHSKRRESLAQLQRALNSDHGKRILAHLRSICYVDLSTIPASGHGDMALMSMCAAEGRREVYLNLEHVLSIDLTKPPTDEEAES